MLSFEISSDLAEVLKDYATTLSDEEIKKALANALNAGHTAARRAYAAYAKREDHADLEALMGKKFYRVARADARKDVVTATGFMSSPVLSLRTFVTARKPVSILVRKQATLSHAFMMGTSAGDKDAGVFGRDYKSAKVAPIKGTYAGRIIKRGPNKGSLMKRQRVIKKFTTDVAAIGNQGFDEVMQLVDLPGVFKDKLDAMLAKRGAQP